MAFDPLKDMPNFNGKVILVTGGNTGIGAATIKFLARRSPSCIYLCARPVSVRQGEALASELKSSFQDVNIQVRPLDLSSLDNIKQFAASFLKEAERLDLLFLNAGISTTLPALTKEGYESQFGVNHVGHALLTQLLMPKLLETAAQDSDVRVLVTASKAAYIACPKTGLVLSDMKEPGPLASPYQRYAHSKLANILFARKLAQVYPSIKCVSYNPGQVRTDIFKKATGLNKWLMMTIGAVFILLTGVTPEKGAENGLWLATSKELQNGAYYEPIGVLEDQKRFIADQKMADELWDWTNKELKQHGVPGWPKA
ncbi:NAD(P)-binding protein [Xylariaceae sp. FL1651]|nr:NAD(P)-binding protein [Xylariaceae sp. FL1651]